MPNRGVDRELIGARDANRDEIDTGLWEHSQPALIPCAQGGRMATFLQELNEQRLDDHRFYHHSRVNQTLHLISAC